MIILTLRILTYNSSMLITEAFGLDKGLGQIAHLAHHWQSRLKYLFVNFDLGMSIRHLWFMVDLLPKVYGLTKVKERRGLV